MIKKFDSTNLFRYASFNKKPFVLRAAFGIYYSRSALAYLVNNIFLPPFYSQMILLNPNRTENFGSPFFQSFQQRQFRQSDHQLRRRRAIRRSARRGGKYLRKQSRRFRKTRLDEQQSANRPISAKI